MSRKRSFPLGSHGAWGIGLLSFSALLFSGQAMAAESGGFAAGSYFQQVQPPQEIYISGTVKDKLGSVIPGVTVRILGGDSTAGVSTGEDGRFTIKANPKGTLEFSHINYKTNYFPINNSVELDVLLDAKEGNMDEVVVVGYGNQRRLNVVSSQSTVNVEDLKTPVANVSAMLAGRIAGLVGVQRSGEPGRDGGDLWIRGIATFSGEGNPAGPVIYIDGVPNRSLGQLEPEDIESITTLKDAAATAVYGVAGANGVILIKTKGGKAGKPAFNVRADKGITMFTMTPQLADGITYMNLTNEAQIASGFAPNAVKYSQDYINRTASGEDPFVYPNVDWMDALFNNKGDNRRVNLSARGGATNANYYVSLTYYDEQGLLKSDALEDYNAGTRYKRYNFTSNLNLSLTPTTRFELGFQGYISEANYPGENSISGGQARASSAAFGQAMQITPVAFPIMYPGNFVPGISAQGDQRNPYADITQRGFTNQFSSQLYSNVRLNQDLSFITEGLSLTSMFAFDTYNTQNQMRTKRRDTWYVNQTTPRNPDGTLNLDKSYSGNNTLGFTNQVTGNKGFYTESALNYTKDIGASNVTGMFIYTQNDRTGSTPADLTASIPQRNRGIAGRGTYSYDSRYFIELNFGYNGSENFAPENRYGFFPSAGIGWVVSNEKFYEKFADIVQFLKIRYSDGVVGAGSGGSRFGFLTFVTQAENQGARPYTFGGAGARAGRAGAAINQYGTAIAWSEARKRNLGLEFKVLNNRLSFIVDAFKERRTGVFLRRQSLPDFMGLLNAPYANVGIIDNKGIDGTVEAMAIPIGNTSLTLRGNFSYNIDEVIDNDQPAQKYPWLDRTGTNYLARLGYVAIGLFQDEDDISKSPVQTFGPVRPGDIKYKDLNGDGQINADDRQTIGRGDVPAIVYGFGSSLTWKNFYVDAFFQGSAMADRMISGDGVIPFNNSTGADRSNLFAAAVDRWTVDNPVQNPLYPRLGWGAQNANNTIPSTWWVKDVSFIRLKTAELGYNFSKDAFRKIGVKSSRVYVQGVNLLTISKFDLWDPELNTNNGTVYPNITTVSVGIQANF